VLVEVTVLIRLSDFLKTYGSHVRNSAASMGREKTVDLNASAK